MGILSMIHGQDARATSKEHVTLLLGHDTGMLLNIRKLSVSFPDRTVIERLSFSVAAGEIVALIGANGCGKSTLFDLIACANSGNKELLAQRDIRTDGELFLQRGMTLSYLRQQFHAAPLNRDNQQWNEQPHQTACLCKEFGIDPLLHKTDELSEGERQKLAIVLTLLNEADLTLFDEPTNYLDLAGITAFEQQVELLRRRGRSAVIVSHDRSLIDQVADRTIYMTQHGIYRLEGGFSDAWSLSESDVEARLKRSHDIRNKISHLQQEVYRRMAWSSRKERSKKGAGSAKPAIAKQAAKMAVRAKSAERKIQREVNRLNESKPFIPKKLNLRFPEYSIKQRNVFSLESVSFTYNETTDHPAERLLLKRLSLGAATRDKICLMGANGTGKSTLFRIILGQLEPQVGRRSFNDGVRVRSLPQGLVGFWEHDTLLANFRDCHCDESTVRQFLGAALIRRDKVHQLLEHFSYGELMRAAIVRCILERVEFLLLDEPTSHLDIESIELLENLLRSFAGGFLAISHDRYFIERLCHKLYILQSGQLQLI